MEDDELRQLPWTDSKLTSSIELIRRKIALQQHQVDVPQDITLRSDMLGDLRWYYRDQRVITYDTYNNDPKLRYLAYFLGASTGRCGRGYSEQDAVEDLIKQQIDTPINSEHAFLVQVEKLQTIGFERMMLLISYYWFRWMRTRQYNPNSVLLPTGQLASLADSSQHLFEKQAVRATSYEGLTYE